MTKKELERFDDLAGRIDWLDRHRVEMIEDLRATRRALGTAIAWIAESATGVLSATNARELLAMLSSDSPRVPPLSKP